MRKKSRLLHDANPPNGALPVRLAIVVQQVSNYHVARFRCAKRGVTALTVVSALNDADFAEFLADNIDLDVVRICEGNNDYNAAIASGSLGTRIYRVLDTIEPDVVVVSGWSFPESLASIEWARANGRRVVVMSDSQVHDAPRTAFREGIKRRVVSACDAALVAADVHADYVTTLGIDKDAVFVGYDVVDNIHFAVGADAARLDLELRAQLDLPERYLLACGRFIAKKNYPRLIETFARCLENCDTGHHLIILGDGPERSRIVEAISAHGVTRRVQLPGFQSYETLPTYYGLSDGFVHVSLTEQWGLVVNEAAAAGLPLVVSAPCGSASTLVTNENGRIVDPNDVDAMVGALTWLMTLSPDDRAAHGAASRRIVADWGPERFAAGLSSAAIAALARPQRNLPLIDRFLFARLGRMRISQVS